MKKIISMVLALVMVFAIAASASAITGDNFDQPAPTPGVGPYSITDLYLIKNIPTGFGLLSPEKIAAGTAYIANNAIYFAFEFKTTAAPTMDDDDFTAPWFAITAVNGIIDWVPNIFQMYKVESSAINPVSGASFDYFVNAAGDDVKSIVVNMDLGTDAPAGTAAQYMIVGGGIVRGTTSDTIIAEIMGNESIKFFGKVTSQSQFEDLFDDAIAKDELDDGKTIYDNKGNALFTVTMTGYAGTVPTSSETLVTFEVEDEDSGYIVSFVIDLSKTKGGVDSNVKNITISVPDGEGGYDTYGVVDTGYYVGGNSTEGLYFTTSATTRIQPGDTGYADLAKAYKAVMDFFGFKFAQKGILLPSHFAAKFSDFYAYDTVKVPFSTVTITDPDIELPPTGDAATSIGFVMIALAIVAASAVAYKKVRG